MQGGRDEQAVEIKHFIDNFEKIHKNPGDLRRV